MSTLIEMDESSNLLFGDLTSIDEQQPNGF